MVYLSKLPLIETAEDFFSADKIAFVDILEVTDAPNLLRIKLELNYHAFWYNNKLYLPIILKGSPENLFKKVKKGVQYEGIEGFNPIIIFDGDLVAALNQKKIYNMGRLYKAGKLEFAPENEFYINRYIKPYASK